MRVYYEDTDVGGIVYYANYLKFMERARTEWLRAWGFEQDLLMHEQQVMFAVRAVSVEYLRPARFNQLLEVTVEPVALRRASLDVAHRIMRHESGDNETLVTGRIKLACLNTGSLKPAPIPEAMLGKFTHER
ncbi:MAG: tol-pal system-associated acyl-CoA thioesterase [Gammaproteobacteria bacterium]